jgi:predicted dinucleotide-utilizing enzyme
VKEFVLQYILVPAGGALSAALIPLVGLAIKWLIGKIGNDTLRAALATAYDSIDVAVRHVEQAVKPTLASALADGVITEAEKLQLRTIAIAAVKSEVPQALATIRKILGLSEDAFDAWLLRRIEAAVLSVPAREVEVPVDPATILPPGVTPAPSPAPVPRPR